jgi:type II secretory pathway component GspD/PulD (secretin)
MIKEAKQTIRSFSRIAISSCMAMSFVSSPVLVAEDAIELPPHISQEMHDINFQGVPMIEFIRFVGKISKVNFIYNTQDLQFNVSLTTGKPVSASEVVKALIQMLHVHGLGVLSQDSYFVIKKGEEIPDEKGISAPLEGLMGFSSGNGWKKRGQALQFSVYKLKYHQGSEIQEAMKKIAVDLRTRPDNASQKILGAIESTQWIKATNSLLFSGDDEAVLALNKLADSLDVPSRQVFIEVLVIETDAKKGMDFGLQWGAGGSFKEKIGFGMGSFPAVSESAPFASTFKGINASNGPSGTGQFPIGKGFDLGVIGDMIMHKGMSYLSLGALVSALQMDGDSTIVLNQKIVTQDNKNSKIFVGDNIPFTGSVVQTVGQSQQNTANIEYRDVGVSLSITPMLGDDDIITLDLDEEITEAVDETNSIATNSVVNGIRTTKTNMATHVHVPDKHFLILSGMIRNAKLNRKTGVPFLSSIPLIGGLFRKTKRVDEKRNIVVFVRPHIIRTVEDYKNITERQKEIYEEQSLPADFKAGLDLLSQSQNVLENSSPAL